MHVITSFRNPLLERSLTHYVIQIFINVGFNPATHSNYHEDLKVDRFYYCMHSFTIGPS